MFVSQYHIFAGASRVSKYPMSTTDWVGVPTLSVVLTLECVIIVIGLDPTLVGVLLGIIANVRQLEVLALEGLNQ